MSTVGTIRAIVAQTLIEHARRPRLILLQDHARLPWRFFGRLTAGSHAGL
jgi:hypothetical protein